MRYHGCYMDRQYICTSLELQIPADCIICGFKIENCCPFLDLDLEMLSISVLASSLVQLGPLPFRSLVWLESPFASHLERSAHAFPCLVSVLLLFAGTREGVLACSLTGILGHPSCIWGQEAQFSSPLACEPFFHRLTTKQIDSSMFLVMRPSASQNIFRRPLPQSRSEVCQSYPRCSPGNFHQQ